MYKTTAMENPKQLWENALVNIELSISPSNFRMWFKDTHILKTEEGTVYVGVPNQLVRDWLLDKYHSLILKILRELSENIRSVEYIISHEDKKRKGTERRVQAPPAIGELPLGDYLINKNDNLNPRYTFDAFVVGPFNQLAHSAAQVILKQPGITYNPFFVYGSSGRGKTHLIQAIGNQTKKINPNKKVYYITSERFGVDYISALQNGTANAFKDKYRHYDILIMDDIQFFSSKEKMQEELFHLFNALYHDNKQIIFSSDKHPNFIPYMEDRLKTRFAAGMIVDIPEPDIESRIAILKAKARAHNMALESDVVEFLADTMPGSIRELEGILNSIVCQTQLKERALPLSEVHELVKNSAKPKRSVSIKEAIKKIAEFYDLPEDTIYEKTRRKEVVRPRQLIMYILREDFNISYPTIGAKLGGRDHTTVIHSCEKIRKDLLSDTALGQEVSQVRALLK